MNDIDIETLSNLARIKVPDGEKESLKKEFESILGYVREIKDAPLSFDDVPSLGVVKNVMRNDVVHIKDNTSCETDRKLIMDNVPHKEKTDIGEFVTVKKILN